MKAIGEYVVLSNTPCEINGFIIQSLWEVISAGNKVPLVLDNQMVYVKHDTLEDYGKYKVAHWKDIVGMELER